ncbi:hypothetical protein N7462_009840 [Penicillium macrosclerotiorum]|uniref:uncharacterized protein n=1 Tax=Penicillium macrosclerotiorum TaxID=303699 RepID=UPI002546AD42|nr:uncharacterized protein N7462_009840 [Penicillium macrosclerotiorum]KAJ5668770.1 hypothetical protein N7462_009840 [Penicillium macrosclerotiorum]
MPCQAPPPRDPAPVISASKGSTLSYGSNTPPQPLSLMRTAPDLFLPLSIMSPNGNHSPTPDHPIALRRSHLLAPAPDRLTNTPTTLSITRENTLSGRDFSVHQLRNHEPFDSPQRRTLLFTVTGKLWSNSLHRSIRDAAGRPLLELRRIWWRKQWSVKRAGGAGDDLLSVEMRWAIGMKMAVRVTNAMLAAGRLDEEQQQQQQQEHQQQQLQQRRRPGRRGGRGHPRREPSPPPPYSAAIAEAGSSESSSGPGSGNESDGSVESKGDHVLPSYDSVRRLGSRHSLRDLLDAVEPPAEPAPASSYAFLPQRRYSEAVVEEKLELKVEQVNSTLAGVKMGDRRIIQIRRGKVMDFTLSGPLPRWEVEIAEGVDLLLAVSIVLIMAEFVRHEYRVRINN